ncbi:hypothetical protein [Clostridium sp.]
MFRPVLSSYNATLATLLESSYLGTFVNVMTIDDTYIYLGLANGGTIRGFIVDDNFIYVCGDVTAYTFKQFYKADCTLVATGIASPTYNCKAMVSDNLYLYIVSTNNIYKFLKEGLVLIATSPKCSNSLMCDAVDSNNFYASGAYSSFGGKIMKYSNHKQIIGYEEVL